jgi:hypothetical protein
MATNNSIAQNASNESTTLTRRQFLTQAAIVPAALALPNLPEVVTQEAPNSQSWRTTWPEVESTSKANAARLQTWELDLYPTLYPEREDYNPHYAANLKGALHQIVEALDYNDLEGVYRLARMYALFPDIEGRVQAKQLEDWPWAKGEIRVEGNEIIPVKPVEQPKPSREKAAKALAAMQTVLDNMKAELG